MQSNLYYELFSNFMGKGDKESFAHALRAARLHYHLLETPVGSLGISKCVTTARHELEVVEIDSLALLQCCKI